MIEENSDNEELYEHHRFVASDGQIPLRVDKFLMNFIENATRNKIQQAAKAKYFSEQHACEIQSQGKT